MSATRTDNEPSLARPLGFLEKQCPVRAALDVLNGRWKPMILLALKDRPVRYSEIQRAISGISAQALSRQLGQLVADGVIVRESSSGTPLYQLTQRGEQLSTIMELIETWGEGYLQWRSGNGAA
jgi:DNA-binding HxlR family transcriptional regulator